MALEGRSSWMALVSLAVCRGQSRRGCVRVSCGDRTPQGSGLGRAGSARPRAASCAINDKAAAELCLCPGSLCVLGLSVPALGQWMAPRVGSVQGWGAPGP